MLLSRLYSAFAKVTRWRFDGLSGTYETILEGKFYEAGIVANAFSERYFPNSISLEVGCGTGLLGIELKALENLTLDGVDMSEKMIIQANLKKVYRKLLVCNFLDYSVDDKYDFVLASSMFQFVAMPKEFFIHCHSVLVEGGHLLFTFDAAKKSSRLTTALYFEHSKADILEALELSGFRDVKFGQLTHLRNEWRRGAIFGHLVHAIRS